MPSHFPIDENCPIARVTEILGEPWTLMILREAFLGICHFNDFERELGIARNVLSTRLKKLVELGLMKRSPCPRDRRVVEYRLSEAGQNMFPVMVCLTQWASRWLCDKPQSLRFVESETGLELPLMQVRSNRGEVLALHQIRMQEREGAEAMPELEPDSQRGQN